MNKRNIIFPSLLLAASCIALLPCISLAGSATWKSAPTTGDWNTSGNWSAGGPPNATVDIATFSLSSATAISLSATTAVNSIVFTASAPGFSITSSTNTAMTISGSGIINNSGTTQNFFTNPQTNTTGNGSFTFSNGASAGILTIFTNAGASNSNGFGVGGVTSFSGSATAGSATFNNNGATLGGDSGGQTTFGVNAKGGNAIINNKASTVSGAGSGITTFFGFATAGNATINNIGTATSGANGGATTFNGFTLGGTATINNRGGSVSGDNASGVTDFTVSSNASAANIINSSGSVGNALGGITNFNNNSTAGSATITNNGRTVTNAGGGTTNFSNTATAGNATITNNGVLISGAGAGATVFNGTSTAGSAAISNKSGAVSGANGGETIFLDESTGGNSTIITNGGTASGANGGFTQFYVASTSGSAAVTTNGGTVNGAFGAETGFFNTSTAGSGTFTTNGGSVSGAFGGQTVFNDTSTAGGATLITNGGTGGGQGGQTLFFSNADGGTARAITNAGGSFDISGLSAAGMSIGSIEGSGTYFLSGKTLTVGGNNLSTVVSGVIRDGGTTSGTTGGSLIKTGTGMLTLSGSNFYTGATTVNGGGLKVNGSIAAASTVTINTGATLSGSGNINGAVVIANNGILAPGNSPGTLTVGSLVLNGGSILNYELTSPGVVGSGVNDLVVVNGNLTLDGTLNFLNTVSSGTYRLFTYSGSFINNTLDIGTLSGSNAGKQFTIQTNVADEVDLIVTSGSGGANIWKTTPTSGDWNTAANWTSGTVPNDAAAVATFGVSGTTNVSLSSSVTVASIVFNAGGSAFTIDVSPASTLALDGGGIVNNSGTTQTLNNKGATISGSSGSLTQLTNNSTLGSNVVVNNSGVNVATSPFGYGVLLFKNTSSAGSATINDMAGTFTGGNLINGVSGDGGVAEFQTDCTAGTATINNLGSSTTGVNGGLAWFQTNATAGNANINNYGGSGTGAGNGFTYFYNTSTSGSAIIHNMGATGTAATGGFTLFRDNSSAGHATITNDTAAVSGTTGGGVTQFTGTSSAATASITNNGAGVGGAVGGSTIFTVSGSAGHANLVNNGGTANLAHGGVTTFLDNSTAASGTITNSGGAAVNSFGGGLAFYNSSNAGSATIDSLGGALNAARGGETQFNDTSSGGSAMLIAEGGTNSGGGGGETEFRGSANAGSATLIANGGTNGGSGGSIFFQATSDGAMARVIMSGNSSMDIAQMTNGGVGIGSIEGSGTVRLGSNALTTGSNNRSTTFAGVMQDSGTGAGGGSLIKTGTGTLNLTGANTYTGATTVQQGTLAVNGALSGSSVVTVNAGASLSGTGNIQGLVIISNGGILAPGNSPGTVTVGALTLNSASILNYQLSTPGVVGNGINDLTIVNGALTLDGTLNVTDAGGFGEGSYRLINYSGSFTNNGLGIGTIPGGVGIGQLQIQTSVAGEVNLIVTGTGSGSGMQFWDGPNISANNAVDGGSGIWNNSTTNWTNVSGSSNSQWQNAIAVFSGSAGTVALGDTIAFTGIQFTTDGYTVTGSGGNTLTPTGTAGLTTNTGVTATISAPITGSGAIIKLGAGVLVLSGSNNYSGGTALNAGQLNADSNSAFGTGLVTINSGTVGSSVNGTTLANDLSVKGSFAVAPSPSGTMVFNGNVNLNGATRRITSMTPYSEIDFDGVISNGGVSLFATGFIGDISFGGTSANTYTGVTTVGDNVCFEMEKSVANGAVIGDLVINTTGVAKLDAADQIADTSTVTVNAPGNFTFGAFNLNGFNETIATLSGTGTVQLNDGSKFSGTTAGTLTVGSGTFSGVISDASAGGQIVKTGTGTLVFTGANTYTGGTQIGGGLLSFADGSLGTTGTVAFTGNSTLQWNGANTEDISSRLKIDDGVTATIDTQGNTITFASGLQTGTLATGALVKTGTGTLNVLGNNTYGGGTTINAGIIKVGDGSTPDASLGSGLVTVNAGGTLTLDLVNDETFINNIANHNLVILDDNINSNYTASGNISGTGAVNKTGGNIVTLSGSNTYTGATRVQQGTLKAGSATAFSPVSAFSLNTGATLDVNGFFNTIGSLSNGVNGGGLITNSGTTGVALFVGNDNTNTSFSGSITNGAGTLTLHKIGTGMLTLTGSFANKGLDVSGGSLIVNGIVDGDVQVDGAIYGGNNTIGGELHNNGVVSPGNSPGTITVNGNYSQSSGGKLVIQIAGLNSGQYDLLAVNGAASLDGALQLVRLNNFQIKAGGRVTFLTAGGGVTGNFASVDTGTILGAKVFVEPNDAYVLFTQNSFLTLAAPGHANFTGLTQNQGAVAANLDFSVHDLRASALVNFLDNEPVGRLPSDFDLIAPEELAALYDITFASVNVEKANLVNRMQDVRNGSTGFVSLLTVTDPHGTVGLGNDGKATISGKDKDVFQPAMDNRWGVFISGNGDFVNVDGDNNARGYDFTTSGVTLGVDYRVNKSLVIGAALDYAHTWTNLSGGGKIDADSGKLGIYATWFRDGFYANSYAGGGFNSYDTHRFGLLGMPRGSTDGGEFSTFLSGGYDFHRNAWTFGPIISLEYAYAGISAYTETGSLVPLHIVSQSQDSLKSNFGWRLSYAARLGGKDVTPQFKAGWQHEYAYGALPVSGQFASGAGGLFTVHGPGVGRDSAVVEAGVNVQWNPRTSAYLNYDGVMNDAYQSHNITGGMSFSF